MNYEKKYKEEAMHLKPVNDSGQFHKISWRSPSNIALVKYWGKKEGQIPMNPSLSFSLEKSYTETVIEYHLQKTGSSIEFTFEGRENSLFSSRILSFLNQASAYLPFLQDLALKIDSRNSFPHSSGIASSASGMSALVLALCSIERNIFKTHTSEEEFLQKASFLSRLASGSASRSVHPNFAVWGHHPEIENSTDELAIPLPFRVNEKFGALCDAILITNSKQKEVGSSEGHNLMQNHPYREARIAQANRHIIELIRALESGNELDFIRIVENEALSLHALMMSAEPGYSLLNDNTWSIISRIREFRRETGIMATFTLDAGANVHFIYPESGRKVTLHFIQHTLVKYCENHVWIDDKMGIGPEQII
jgi:diphosphomevalonate decarboxylase